jgi:hypothetical protein
MQAQEQTREQLLAEINALKAQMSGLPKSLSLKVSEKGAVSVYGLGRFPLTLYVDQWDRLINIIDAIKSFIEANRSSLKTK